VAVKQKPLAVVLGENCQRIRTMIGITQDELARHARDVGLRWTASKVGDFEKGRRAPTFATVLLVSLALHSAAQNAARRGGREVPTTLAELLSSEGEVRLNDDVAFPAGLVSAVCKGQPWSAPPWHLWAPEPGTEPESSLKLYRDIWGDAALAPPERVLLRSGLTEDRLARQLGIERAGLADISYLLWQSTFSEERDRRAGDANQQKKGRISREMRAELEKALADGNA
jgi:transcriptional regulator with XRE-family HTH domain